MLNWVGLKDTSEMLNGTFIVHFKQCKRIRMIRIRQVKTAEVVLKRQERPEDGMEGGERWNTIAHAI